MSSLIETGETKDLNLSFCIVCGPMNDFWALTLSCIVKFCFASTEIEVVFLWLDIFLEHDTSDRILRDLAFDFDSTEQAIPQ